jgi:hypothetical protein
MPGWLMWTLVGFGAWLVASVPFAFLAGYLLSRRTLSRRRFVFLAGPRQSACAVDPAPGR